MVFALAITETLSWGILYYSFSVFIKPMQDDLHWSRGALTGAYSLEHFLNGIVGVVVGRVDKHGTRLLMSQQLREATPFGRGPRYLVRDNDSKFGGQFSQVAAGAGIKELARSCTQYQRGC